MVRDRNTPDVVRFGTLDRVVWGLLGTLLLGINTWALVQLVELKERVARLEERGVTRSGEREYRR